MGQVRSTTKVAGVAKFIRLVLIGCTFTIADVVVWNYSFRSRSTDCVDVDDSNGLETLRPHPRLNQINIDNHCSTSLDKNKSRVSYKPPPINVNNRKIFISRMSPDNSPKPLPQMISQKFPMEMTKKKKMLREWRLRFVSVRRDLTGILLVSALSKEKTFLKIKASSRSEIWSPFFFFNR